MGKIISTHKGDMLFETKSGNHTILNDVPATPELGGSDRAPTPPEYLIMSLSSCVAAFLVKYCKQVNINTEGMSVEVDFEKSDKPVHLKDIKVLINLPNAEVGKHENALKRVCEHCVVHETLTHIDISLSNKVVKWGFLALFLTITVGRSAYGNKLGTYNLYFAGIVKHFNTTSNNKEGNMGYLVLSKDYKKGKWLFETGTNI